MANYATLKAAIADVVKTNGSQAITGDNLQQVLFSIVNSIGTDYLFAGVATPSTSVGTPDQNVFYLTGAGTFGNMGSTVTIPVGSIGVFKYNGSWSSSQIKLFEGIDDAPTAGSDNLVKSGGVSEELMNISQDLDKKIVNVDDGVRLYDSNASKPTRYFVNPFVVGKRYFVKNASAKVISLVAYDSSKQSLGYITDSHSIAAGSEVIITFTINNTAYIGGYVDDAEYILIVKAVDEEQVKEDYLLQKNELAISASSSGTHFFPFLLIKDYKYKVINHSSNLISFGMKFDAAGQVHGSVSINSGDYAIIVPDENYNYVGGYSSSSPYSVGVVTYGIYDDINTLADNTNFLKSQVGERLIIQNAGVGRVFVPFYFEKGKQYIFTNTSTAILSLQYKTDEKADAIAIKSPVEVGESYIFVPNDNAKFIGGYSSVGYSATIESAGGVVPVVNKLGNEASFSKSGAGSLFSYFAFEKGKQYKVRNNTTAILSVVLRNSESGENIQVVASPLNPEAIVYFTAQENLSFIGGYSTIGYNITVSAVDGYINGLNALNPLPSYYESYLEDKISMLDRLYNDCGGKGDSFIFITDTHLIDNSLKCLPIIQYLSKRIFVNKLIHGGDSGSITANNMPVYGWDAINEAMRLFYKYITNAMKGSGKFFGMLGNHDFNDRIYSGGGSTITGIGLGARRNILLSLSPDNIVLGDSDDGCYYYYDNAVAKLRYIVLDTSFGNVNGGANIGGVQFQWFVDTVMATPAGYELVVLGHVPFYTQLAAADAPYISYIGEAINKVNERGAGTAVIGGVSYPYNFEEVSTSVILNLFGHTHLDGELFEDNVLSVVTINNALGRYPSYNMFEDNPLTKVNGTISEQAFDVFLLNEDTIHAIRIGAGGDRHFHKGVINPTNSQDLSDLVEFITPSSWQSCDSATVELDQSGDVPTWVYTNNILSVASDGVITLNGGTGDAMVVAMDNQLNKEIFLIHVD